MEFLWLIKIRLKEFFRSSRSKSYSSINDGMSNIIDSSIIEMETYSLMDDQPKEIINIILKDFKRNDLLKFRSVCKKWKNVIDFMIFDFSNEKWPSLEECIINGDNFHLLKYLNNYKQWNINHQILISLSENEYFKKICENILTNILTKCDESETLKLTKNDELNTLKYYSSINNIAVIKYMLNDKFVTMIKEKKRYEIIPRIHYILKQIFNNANKYGNLDIIKFVCEIDTSIPKYLHLTENIKNGHNEIVKWWLEKDIEFFFVFIKAAEYNNMQLVDLMLSKGINVNHYYKLKIGDAKHPTALAYAAASGHLEMVKFLISKGAKIDIYNNHVIAYGAKKNRLEIVKYLIDNGADIHTKNEVALIWSASAGHLDMVKYLQSNGANIYAQHNLAFKLSKSHGHKDVYDFLSINGNVLNFSDYLKMPFCWDPNPKWIDN
jgi:ankyrin repeat protein